MVNTKKNSKRNSKKSSKRKSKKSSKKIQKRSSNNVLKGGSKKGGGGPFEFNVKKLSGEPILNHTLEIQYIDIAGNLRPFTAVIIEDNIFIKMLWCNINTVNIHMKLKHLGVDIPDVKSYFTANGFDAILADLSLSKGTLFWFDDTTLVTVMPTEEAIARQKAIDAIARASLKERFMYMTLK